ncbi:MAG: DUF2339 domain-containing protein [Bacteroidota bacterium]
MNALPLSELQHQLEELSKRQGALSRDLFQLKSTFEKLQTQPEPSEKTPEEAQPSIKKAPLKQVQTVPPTHATDKKPRPTTDPIQFENWLGGNLLSKIGIIIFVLGAGFLVKFAIDRHLFSPVLRIIAGYILSAGLMGIAIRLKEKLENYAALLFGGGIAIGYFTTFAAHSIYEMIPQGLSFGLMLGITVLMIAAAYKFEVQIMALVGMVGAYAVPILLSDDTGAAEVFLSYVCLVNTGIIFVAFRKRWVWLNGVSFLASWTLFCSVLTDDLFLVFGSIFFLTFYIIFIAYQVHYRLSLKGGTVVALLFNGLIYIVLGLFIIEEAWHPLFLGANALVHATFAYLMFVRRGRERASYYFLTTLALSTGTMAIYTWTSEFWWFSFLAIESLGLYLVSHFSKDTFYQKLANAGIMIATFFMLLIWADGYSFYTEPLLSQEMTSQSWLGWRSLSVLLVWGIMYFVEENRFQTLDKRKHVEIKTQQILMGGVLVVLGFILGWLELNTRLLPLVQEGSWHLLHVQSTLWIYTLSFVMLLGWLNQFFWKKEILFCAMTFLGMGGILVWSFMLSRELGSFHEAIVMQQAQALSGLLTLRYVGHGIVFAFLIHAIMWTKKRKNVDLSKALEILTLFTFVGLFSYEGWLQYHSWTGFEAYEVAVSRYTRVIMSISWAVIALLVVGLGFMYKASHWRLSAILLLFVALIKLILWDMVNVSLGVRTVLFLVLGGILLVVSYLYQRKHAVNLRSKSPQEPLDEEEYL